MAKIKILKEAEPQLCRCGNWFEHWKKFSGLTIRLCGIKDCTGFELTGAKAQKADSEDKTVFAVPVCAEHAESDEILETYDSITLVSTVIKETCGVGGMTYLKEGQR